MPDDNNVSLEISEAFEDADKLNIGKTFLEAQSQKGLPRNKLVNF